MKLNLHSIIDVITNSSTEIYTYARDNAVEKMYEMINAILVFAGSDKKAEDLFTVTIEPDDFDQLIEQIDEDDNFDPEDFDSDGIPAGIDKDLFEKWVMNAKKIEDWKERRKFDDETIIPYLQKDSRWKLFVDYYEVNYIETSIHIRSKDGLTLDPSITKIVNGLFYSEESSNY